MNATQLLTHFDRLAEAPDAVPRLRRFILALAVRGKLVEQDAADESAPQLLKRIQAEKARLVKSGAVKASKAIADADDADSSLIPNTWQWSSLAEVGFISPRNSAPDDQLASFVPMPCIAADYGTPNRHEVRPWREIKTGYTHFAEGDVGLAKITPCFENGKSTVFRGLMSGIGAGTTELHIVRPVLLSADYILIYLKSSLYIATGIPRMTGTAGQKRVPSEYFTQSPFPLPPLAEQHRIVAKVDELMALCDQLEAAQQQRERRRDRLAAASLQRLNQPTEANPATDQSDPAEARQQVQREQQKDHARFHLQNLNRLTTRPKHIKAMRQTILNLAVRGKLVEQDAADEPAQQLLKRIQAEKARLVKTGAVKASKPIADADDVDASLIPNTWRWSSLAEVGFISPRNSAPDDQLASFVPMPCIAADYGTPNRHEVRPWREIKTGYTHFAEGDVGLAKITPCFENGKSTVFRGLMGGIGAGTTELHIVRPVLLSADYILIYLKSSLYIATGIPRMTGTAGQKRVPSEYFTQSPFPLPPLAEQHRIVAKVDELMALCDQLEAQLTQSQTDSRRLLEAVLEAALTPA